MLNQKNIFSVSLLTSLIAASLHSNGVLAQENDKNLERIEVTGTHIRRTDLEGPSPVTSIGAEDIAKTGVTDLISLFT